MAYYVDGIRLDFNTGTDLTASPWRAVKLNSSALLVAEADGDAPAIGILTDNVADGSVTTARCQVQMTGVAKVELGGTVTLGTHLFLMGTTGGKAIAATTGKYHFAQPLQSGVSGDIISCLLCFGMIN